MLYTAGQDTKTHQALSCLSFSFFLSSCPAQDHHPGQHTEQHLLPAGQGIVAGTDCTAVQGTGQGGKQQVLAEHHKEGQAHTCYQVVLAKLGVIHDID